MCHALHVSESGYYRSLRTRERQKRQEILSVKIQEIIDRHEDNDNYGARRIYLALIQGGETLSYSTVYRIMKANGQLKKPKRHPNGITQEDAQPKRAKT